MFFLNITVPSSPWFFMFLFGHLVMSKSLRPYELEHTRLLCPPLSPGVCSNSCPFSQWSYLTISSSTTHFSLCLHSFPASESFPIRWLFALGGQNWSFSNNPSSEYSWLISFRIDWFDILAIQGTLKSLLQTTIQKHQFFGPQPSLCSNSHMDTQRWEKPELWLYGPLSAM